MTTDCLLDTNVCIAIRDLLAAKSPRDPSRQQRLERLRQRWSQVDASRLAMSLITLGELQFGVSKSAQPETARAHFDRLRAVVPVALLDEATAGHYGQVRAQLESAGQPIGPNDTWIAAQALASGRTVVTNNLGEFARVPALQVEDWTA